MVWPDTPPSEPIDGRVARWAGHRHRRREAFVDTALDAIANCGPDTTIEQIAAHAGVTRTKLYRFFDGAQDLRRAVAERATKSLATELGPVWRPDGCPADTIPAAVGAYIQWLDDHPNLYLYLDRHAQQGDAEAANALSAVRSTISVHLTNVLAAHFTTFGVTAMRAEPLGFGVIGLIESVARRWVFNPDGRSREAIADQLAQWTWHLIDQTLRSDGVILDPHQPLGVPPALAGPPA